MIHQRRRRLQIPAQGNALGKESFYVSRTLKEFASAHGLCKSSLLDAAVTLSSMSQSLSSLWIHLIFSTRDRFPFLKEPELKNDMHRYLASVLRSHDCETLIVGGTNDDVHALFDLSRKYAIATIAKEIKRTSSAWIKEVSPLCKKFHWQNGYGAFSVSQSHLDRVYRYIEQQEQHHRRVSFQDEYRRFLKKYGIKCNEQYVWN